MTERLRTAEWRVLDCPLSMARRLIVMHHYARGASNTATFCHGLFRRADLACFGVAWWIPPTRSCAEASWGGDWRRVLSLSRLVLLPGAPKNSATHLLAASVKIIRQSADWDCLLTYADTWQGHTGGIYRAANWRYCGLTEPEPVWVNSDGRMVARKCGPVTRTKSQMEALGYTFMGKHAKHKYMLPLRGDRQERRS